MKRKLLLLVNKKSGKETIEKYVPKIIEEFEENNFEVDVMYTKITNNATQIIKNYDKDFDLVVCCGGDGTLNQTISGLTEIDKKVSVGFIPLGTANDFAKNFDITDDVLYLPHNILSYKSKKCDTGKFNDKYFNYIAAFGTCTEVSYTTKKSLKKRFGKKAYYAKAIKDFFNIKSHKVKLTFDDQVIEDEFVYGGISNSCSIAGIQWLKQEDIDLGDGKFEAIFIRKPKNPIETFNIFNSIIQKDYENKKEILYFKTDNLQLELEDNVDWTLDGEYGGTCNKVNINALKHNMEFIVPEKNL